MTDTTAQSDVFLSHNSADKPAVESLAQRLLAAGIRPWLDSWNLIPGDPWQEGIEEALDTCGPAPCSSAHPASGRGTTRRCASRWTAAPATARAAFRVIPVLLPGADPADPATLPRFLGRMTWVDFRGGLDDAEAFRRLVAGIRGVAPGAWLVCRQHYSSAFSGQRVRPEDADLQRARATESGTGPFADAIRHLDPAHRGPRHRHRPGVGQPGEASPGRAPGRSGCRTREGCRPDAGDRGQVEA